MAAAERDSDSMATLTPDSADADGIYDREVEYTTETRPSFATSEFWVLLVLSVVLVFFAYDSGDDSYTRDEGWRYVTGIGIAYLISRGLAKAGSYESFIRRRPR
ncbi:MAG TPA: hypothetical protein VHJ78_09840 [Actinomycetota bacterium]|nr:hypothetical protein [Actinomycetota bacterium]